MDQKFEQETEYYPGNHAELVKKRLGKFIAIKGNELLGVVTDQYERLALRKAGDVLVEFVTQSEPDYRFGDYTKVE